MLSKEEKEAIKKLSSEEKIELQEVLRMMKREGIENFVITRKEYLDIILNLITKLQGENKVFKRAFDRETADRSNDLLELQKKDKMIDLMALVILNYDDQLVINRYKNIDEVKEEFKKITKEKGE